MVGTDIIHGDLFAGCNVTQRKDEEARARHERLAIGFAGVVDVLGAITADAAIKTAVWLDLANPNLAASAHSPPRFREGDSLAQILGDLMALSEANRRETSLALDL
jgi:hypothetical protein